MPKQRFIARLHIHWERACDTLCRANCPRNGHLYSGLRLLSLSITVALRKKIITVRRAHHQQAGFQTSGAAIRTNMKRESGLAENLGESICAATLLKDPGRSRWEPVVYSVAVQVTRPGRIFMPRLRARMVNS